MIKKFNQAKYWVGCSSESAHEILFDLETVLTRMAEFQYIAAFDKAGQWIDEAQIRFEDHEETKPYLNFLF